MYIDCPRTERVVMARAFVVSSQQKASYLVTRQELKAATQRTGSLIRDRHGATREREETSDGEGGGEGEIKIRVQASVSA